MYFCGLIALAMTMGAAACAEDYDGQLEIPAESNKIDIIAPEFSMLYEDIRVNNSNVASGLDVTVDFGDGTVKTVKSGLYTNHTYTRPGKYTIKLSAPTYESSTKEITVGEMVGLNERTRMFADPDNKKILIVSHRAHTTNKNIAENSLASVDDAIAAGADMIETDIAVTSDGVLCISHDGGETDENGNWIDISKNPWSVVKKIKLRDREGNITDQTVPSFEAFLEQGRGRVYYNIDKMDRLPNPDAAFQLVERIGMTESVVFYGNVAADAWAYNERAHVGKWQATPTDFEGKNLWEHYSQISYWPGGCNDASAAYNAGLPVFINLLHVLTASIPEYDIDPGQMDELLKLNPKVAYIQTDCPDELDAFIRSVGRR